MVLMSSKEGAINYQKGDIDLGFCKSCGFIFNYSYNSNLLKYSEDYECWQGYSNTFNNFSNQLVSTLINKFNIKNKNVIEIGGGTGEFLVELCTRGNNNGICFDPAYWPRKNQLNKKVTFIKDYYSEKYSQHKADLIVCRMVLEHIDTAYKLLKTIRKAIADNNTNVCFQVPNANEILKNGAFWDIYYEHCNYFSKEALIYLFHSAGFNVFDMWDAFNKQYLLLMANTSLKKGRSISLSRLKRQVKYFQSVKNIKINDWSNRISAESKKEKSIVIWGSSSKAVSFVDTLKLTDEIKYIVDINPFRQNSYLSGSGHRIVGPNYLKNNKPDIIIIMNPVYIIEIGLMIQNLGLEVEILNL
ncbi:class I SAM-dependent methyltransferase [Candidatus Neomarinimicrobiota bacterium]